MKRKTVKEYYNAEKSKLLYGNAIDEVGLWASERLMFSKYSSKSDKILDVGCGAGRTTINLFREGYTNIVGVDIAEELIKYARQYAAKHNLNIQFEAGDATNLPFDSNVFDIAFFSFNGIMSIPKQENRDKALQEIYRVIKPGGVFIFTALDRDSAINRKKFWEEEKERWDKGEQADDLYEYGDLWTIDIGGLAFIHFSNIKETEDFIKRSKFKIIECIRRKNIVKESDIVNKFSGDTVFWVLRKEQKTV